MAIETNTAEEAAAEAYEESVRNSASLRVTEDLAMRAMFRRHGFTTVEGDMEKLDNNKIKQEIFKLLPDHRVTTTADRINEPMHRYEVAGSLLSQYPVPPSEEWDALDAMDRQAWTLAERHIWKLVDDKYNAILQRWTRDELEEGLVLVKAADVMYLTSEPRFIKSEIWTPITDKAEIAMIAAAEQIALFAKQCPALKSSAVPALKKASKQAADKAMAAYTLRAGQENGEEE
jgi:hypothetical protein